MATLPAYDDGSSTESEYYFDPAEDKQEEAAYAWAHALDTVRVKQEPIPQPLGPHEGARRDTFPASEAPSESSEELALPQGSEWSHGAVVVEHNDLVERALAMASHFEQVKQKEEALTADTVNEPSASPVKTTKKTELRTLKKKHEVKVTQKVVSLKAVKAATPTVRAKSVAVGLMQPRKDVGLLKELERGLSVPRTTRKTTASQSSDRDRSPCNGKTAHVKENGKEKEPKRIQYKKTSPSRGTHVSRSPSSYRKTHSKSQPRRHARLPSTRRVERTIHTERSNSPVRRQSRRSRSRSPSRRRVEDRRTRSRSRSATASPRHHYDSQRRREHSHERTRSPSRSSRSFSKTHERYRSRSRDRDRYDHRHDPRPDHYDTGRKSAQSSSHSKVENAHRPGYHEVPSTSRDKDEVSSRPRSSDYKSSRSEGTSHDKDKRIPAQQGGSQTVDQRSRSIARLRGASTPRLQEPGPDQRLSVQVNPIPSAGCKRSPRDPRIRPRVEKSTAPNGKPRADATAALQPAKRFKKSSYVYHDAFERSVFRLKLQEAHLDKLLAAAQGRLSLPDQRFHESRRRNIAADRARLQTENFERFERLYRTTEVRPSDLQRYEDDRNFAKRVVQFKKKQASLQEQKDLFLSAETRDDLWRRLDEEREELIKQNSVMFHKVMMDPKQGAVKHDRGPFSNGPRLATGTTPTTTFQDPANSRVVVGAALQLQEQGLPMNFGSNRARANSRPWFLKG
jgi:hypothetical protein